jgi:hypothetical protein
MKGIGNEFERLKKLKLIYYSINFPEAYDVSDPIKPTKWN